MIHIYACHWLPIVDNMLPEIEQALQTALAQLGKYRYEHDTISYEMVVDVGFGTFNVVEGKINNRGFIQNTISFGAVSGKTAGQVLDHVIPKLRELLADFFFQIIPLSVKNQLAVLHEHIVSFDDFESTTFLPLIDTPAKLFLQENNQVVALLDHEHRQDIAGGFTIPSINLSVERSMDIKRVNGTRSFVSKDETCLLFYAESYAPNELPLLDNAIYKYCALLTFSRFSSLVIEILKQVRDHVIPIRRQLTMALQRNTEEHFVFLTKMKKYLTYGNVKLPVIEKVKNHLTLVHKNEDDFQPKLQHFGDIANVSAYPTIASIKTSIDLKIKI